MLGDALSLLLALTALEIVYDIDNVQGSTGGNVENTLKPNSMDKDNLVEQLTSNTEHNEKKTCNSVIENVTLVDNNVERGKS